MYDNPNTVLSCQWIYAPKHIFTTVNYRSYELEHCFARHLSRERNTSLSHRSSAIRFRTVHGHRSSALLTQPNLYRHL